MENYATKNTDVFLSARRFPEYEEIGICRREPFQRDRDRIMHSRSFRRMMHKTQIFNANMGDHYRNRLTHTLEVAQISRSIGKVLGLNDELIEAIALGHDLGHTPFGHIGERTLDGILHNGLIVCSEQITISDSKSKNIISSLFEAFYLHPKQLPDYALSKYCKQAEIIFDRLSLDGFRLQQDPAFVRAISDHIAGMTDQYAARTFTLLTMPEYV